MKNIFTTLIKNIKILALGLTALLLLSIHCSSGDAPDLSVTTPTASGNFINNNQELAQRISFKFSATIENSGDSTSEITELHYYQSTDSTIDTSDILVGTLSSIGPISAGGSSNQSAFIPAPTVLADTPYYFGTCVARVDGETNISNNCSDSVMLTVAQDFDNDGIDDSGLDPDINNNGLIEIYNLDMLNDIRNDQDSGYELVRSLNFADSASYESDSTNDSSNTWRPTDDAGRVVAADSATNAGWVPIPNLNGKFDGNGHSISNLYIRIGKSEVGLIGQISQPASVHNIGLQDCRIYTYASGGRNPSAGGLMGYAGGMITNSYVTGHVVASGFGATGGLVGESRGRIENSYANVTVSGGTHIGKLVGQNFNGTIKNSYATGNATGSRSASVGGLVGSSTGGTIENSYATGNTSSIDSYGDAKIGGLVGWNHSGTITGSYAAGNVSSNGSGSIGLLTGANTGTAYNNHTAGSISIGFSRAGGLAGYNYKTIKNSYQNSEAQVNGVYVLNNDFTYTIMPKTIMEVQELDLGSGFKTRGLSTGYHAVYKKGTTEFVPGQDLVP